MNILKPFAACVLIAVFPIAHPHEYYAKSFTVVHPWAEPSAAGAKNAEVFVKFDEISAGDKLVAAHSSLADSVELRSATNTVLRNIDLASGKPVELGPRGAHLLLVNLKAPLQVGRSYPMTLEFEKSGPVQVQVSIGAH